ncbi:T9SS type A sorting domain-containing protein [Algibacter mikhailovii]|uniref:T9SS type A sorting domain-containing protein n=1 Tax=Algibacter mikhailovii TaxID=425498 RepID=UPI00249594FC|nr:Ig-like domain-containing protein [Algibacter mikhailovii]
MITKLTFIVLTFFCALFSINLSEAQGNIKYGPDYIVLEAEDTETPLGNLWTVRQPGDTGYLEYLFYPGSSPDPANNTYLEYTGPWQGAGSELEYKFICPKTGTYQVAMRMHSPLRESNNPNKGKWLTPAGETDPVWWELADLRNDFFIKMEGDFTSGSTKHSVSDLKTFHKFFGRGANNWGTCINLEHNGNNGVFYNLTEGEEYTFFLKGRSNTAIVDYITFYDTDYLTHNINNQSTDLALQLPEEIRPYAEPTGIGISPDPKNLRVGTSSQLETLMTPTNGNPSATWSSTNNAIVSVDQNGVITAEGTEGQTATITARSNLDNSLVATSEITLVAFFNIPVTSVSVFPDNIIIVENDTKQLTANILPADSDNKNVTWSSSNDAIAIVDQNGNVTGIAKGTVKIRATSKDNNTIYDEADVEIGALIPQAVSINKINGITVEAFKTQRSGRIEIGEVLSLEVSYSNITEFGGGFARVVVRYAINNGGTAVGPNLTINNIPIGAAQITETVNYTVANHNTGNSSESAVLQIFAALNFGNINSLYSGFEIVPAGSLSTQDNVLKNSIKLFPNPAKDFVTIENINFNSPLKADIYNMNGALVQTNIINSKTHKVSTHQLNPGLYIIQFKSDVAVTTKKLIIK